MLMSKEAVRLAHNCNPDQNLSEETVARMNERLSVSPPGELRTLFAGGLTEANKMKVALYYSGWSVVGMDLLADGCWAVYVK